MGNMLQMQNAGNWTRNYIYDTLTNRLLKHDLLQSSNDYTYDEHGNITSMPHLSLMSWDEKDQLISAGNGTFTSYYNYDAEGSRTRKVVDKGNIIEARYYIDGYEVYRKYTNNTLTLERKTLNISDDEKVFVRIEQKTGENAIMRYQYDNHLGSACLELDEVGQIISYEEYHPFGTTSYRSGRNETEVSLKRYKYCGKERDEETGLYYYGMRYYAAWLCRWTQPDPMKEKYPNISSFVYCANNPINLIDPEGMEIEEGSRTQWNQQRELVQARKEDVESLVKDLGEYINSQAESERDSLNVIQNEQLAILSELENVLDIMNVLENSTQLYSLNEWDVKGQGVTNYDSIDNSICLSYSGTALFVHEVIHAGQFETDDVLFDMESGMGFAVDIYDEVDAFRAQYAYDPNSTKGIAIVPPLGISGVDASWVRSIGDFSLYARDGKNNTSQMPLNASSTLDDLNIAFPNKDLPTGQEMLKQLENIHYKGR
jgi:RHS repeat-associated protein